MLPLPIIYMMYFHTCEIFVSVMGSGTTQPDALDSYLRAQTSHVKAFEKSWLPPLSAQVSQSKGHAHTHTHLILWARGGQHDVMVLQGLEYWRSGLNKVSQWGPRCFLRKGPDRDALKTSKRAFWVSRTGPQKRDTVMRRCSRGTFLGGHFLAPTL